MKTKRRRFNEKVSRRKLRRKVKIKKEIFFKKTAKNKLKEKK